MLYLVQKWFCTCCKTGAVPDAKKGVAPGEIGAVPNAKLLMRHVQNSCCALCQIGAVHGAK